MFKIIYGTSNPFEGIAPTPMVQRGVSSIHYSKKHGAIESYILDGVITGESCPDGNEFSGLWAKSNQLVQNFSESFKNFAIIEDLSESTGFLITNGYAMIRSIDFEDSVFAGLLPFTVSLDLYKEGSFENYGILDPKQLTSFQQAENGNVTVSRSTYAKGFNTEKKAIDNAIKFVQELTGIVSSVAPAFISSSGMDKAILVSFDEKINRLAGTYEVNEDWLYNHYGNSGPKSIYEKTVSVDSGQGGVTVTVNGSLRGGINSTFSELRSDFSGIDFYGFAEEIYEEVGPPGGTLFVRPISKQINESSEDRSIGFSMTYSDKVEEDPYIVDSLSVNWDAENRKTCIRGSVEIRSVDPCPYTRWVKVQNYAATFSIVGWMKARMIALGYGLTFPNSPSSSSTSYLEQEGAINISATLCDKKIAIPTYFDDFNYTISVVPAMPTFVPFQGLDSAGRTTVQKLGGLKRRGLTIQGEGKISNCATYAQAESSLRTHINNLKTIYLDGSDIFLVQHEIKKGTGTLKNSISFTFAWSEQAATIFPTHYLNSNPA